jgi:hypothetical protein
VSTETKEVKAMEEMPGLLLGLLLADEVVSLEEWRVELTEGDTD